ncbi:MAG TPA: hypothetical protein VJ436_12375, partial [Anaerolineales bacterium]|nr:hypothetical protein [Anaerolineales bacterium]
MNKIGHLVSRFRYPLALAALSALALGGYLLTSWRTYALGFPLDDAWIHQTYARNLGAAGGWRYAGGETSGGSTAPLWTAILAAGYRLKLNPYLWTYLLGWAGLWGLALIGMWVFRSLCPERAGWQLWVGAGLAFEWHLVWAAGSGMETLLFGMLVLGVMGVLLRQSGGGQAGAMRIATNYRGASGETCGGEGSARGWFLTGALIGLSAWLRPEGITLLCPALLTATLAGNRSRDRLRPLAWIMLGFGALLLPYLLFNRLSAGAWWPNTLYAKQAEYAELRQAPLGERFLAQAALPLVGAGLFLLPGFTRLAWISVSKRSHPRSWAVLAGVLWVAGFLGSYAWRLPVTYQHGRYAIPAMLVFFVWGSAGLAGWLQPKAEIAWRRVTSRAWGLAVVAMLLAFWIQGAFAYARDVAVIESEMVATARWVAAKTEP